MLSVATQWPSRIVVKAWKLSHQQAVNQNNLLDLSRPRLFIYIIKVVTVSIVRIKQNNKYKALKTVVLIPYG